MRFVWTRLAVNGRISSSVLGVYCGRTTTTFNGNIGGYPAAKSQCETTCGNSNAHMCTSHEIAISKQLGISVGGAEQWIATFAYPSGATSPHNECISYTSGAAGILAHIIDTSGNASFQACNSNLISVLQRRHKSIVAVHTDLKAQVIDNPIIDCVLPLAT